MLYNKYGTFPKLKKTRKILVVQTLFFYLSTTHSERLNCFLWNESPPIGDILFAICIWILSRRKIFLIWKEKFILPLIYLLLYFERAEMIHFIVISTLKLIIIFILHLCWMTEWAWSPNSTPIGPTWSIWRGESTWTPGPWTNNNTPDTSGIRTSDQDPILTTDRLLSSPESICWGKSSCTTKSNSKCDTDLGISMPLEG